MTDGAMAVKALAKRLGSLEELGRRVGVTGRAVANWAEGKRVPRPAQQTALEALGVPRGIWSAPPTPKPAPAPPPAPKPGTPAQRPTVGRLLARLGATAPTRAQLEELATDADAMLVEALADETGSYRDRAAVVSAKRAVLKELGEFRGEAQVTEAQVLRSAAGQRVLGVLFAALRDHPEAARAAADALERLEAAAAPEGKTP